MPQFCRSTPYICAITLNSCALVCMQGLGLQQWNHWKTKGWLKVKLAWFWLLDEIRAYKLRVLHSCELSFPHTSIMFQQHSVFGCSWFIQEWNHWFSRGKHDIDGNCTVTICRWIEILTFKLVTTDTPLRPNSGLFSCSNMTSSAGPSGMTDEKFVAVIYRGDKKGLMYRKTRPV